MFTNRHMPTTWNTTPRRGVRPPPLNLFGTTPASVPKWGAPAPSKTWGFANSGASSGSHSHMATGSFFENRAAQSHGHGRFFERAQTVPRKMLAKQQLDERKQWANEQSPWASPTRWAPSTKWTPAAHPARPRFGHTVDEYPEIRAGRSGLPEEAAGVGCVGEGVLQIQEFLIGFKILLEEDAEVDGAGYFGEATYEALANFQAKVKIDRTVWGEYTGDTYEIMVLLLQRYAARRAEKEAEMASLEARRQALVMQRQAAILATPPRPVDSYTACSERIGTARVTGLGGGSSHVARCLSFDGGDGDDALGSGRSTAQVDLRMPEGYRCSATVDGITTTWGAGHDEAAVFEASEHTVADLVVEHRHYGTVTWSGELTFSANFELARVVSLGPGEVSIYQDTDKPEIGEAVNCKAIVSLTNIKPSNGYTDRDFSAKLEEIASSNGKFISYNAASGRWTFLIEQQ